MVDLEFSLNTLYALRIRNNLNFQATIYAVFFQELFEDCFGATKILFFHRVLPKNVASSQLSGDPIDIELTRWSVWRLLLDVISKSILYHNCAHFLKILSLLQVAHVLHVVPDLLNIFIFDGLDDPKLPV